MASFFSKKQYTAIADEEFTIKLLNERCLEFRSVQYSSVHHWPLQSRLFFWAEFYQLYSSVNSSCCFYLRNKPNTVKKEIFKQTCLMFPLSAHSFPLMFSRNLPCFNGSWSSTFPSVNMELRISHLLLIIRCNLNPKNYPMKHFPRSASPLNILWIRILWL